MYFRNNRDGNYYRPYFLFPCFFRIYATIYDITVNTTVTAIWIGTTIPKNIPLYSPTDKSDGPAAITQMTNIKNVEINGAIQRNFLLVKKSNNTVNMGITTKQMVLIKFKPNNMGVYQFIIVPLSLTNYQTINFLKKILQV